MKNKISPKKIFSNHSPFILYDEDVFVEGEAILSEKFGKKIKRQLPDWKPEFFFSCDVKIPGFKVDAVGTVFYRLLLDDTFNCEATILAVNKEEIINSYNFKIMLDEIIMALNEHGKRIFEDFNRRLFRKNRLGEREKKSYSNLYPLITAKQLQAAKNNSDYVAVLMR